MNIKQLKLFNFWSHKDTTINFDKNFYMILGKIINSEKSNGSGKSTIARGIAYALYGDASDEIKNDDAIYNDAKKMGVMLTFELNNIDYIIKRKVTRGSSPSIHIKVGDGEEIKYGVKAGQEMINAILGADFSIYKNTSYFKQGDINSFSTLTPKEAKEVVIKILQLDIYNNYEKVAKDKHKELDAEVLKLKENITELDTQLNNEILANERPQVTDAQLEKLEKELTEFKVKKEKAEIGIIDKNKALAEVSKKVNGILTLINKAKYNTETIGKRILKLEKLEGKCPTCEHELNKAIRDNIVESLKEEFKPIDDGLKVFHEEHKKITKEELEIENLKIDTHDYNSDISVTNYNIGKIKAQLKQVKEHEAKIKKLKVQITNYEEALADTKLSLKIYDELQKAFGKNGIQAYIIENVIPEIQATTNDILAGLDTSIRINIDSQKELKKGGFGETLNINIITPFGERPYTNYSGGEKTLIDFALRIALSVILTRRSKCKIQTLILDEVFGELDTVNKKIISKALRFIANRFDFKKILIISHAEELQDSFENVIKVVFDGETSHIIEEQLNEV